MNEEFNKIRDLMIGCLKGGNKILVCGNGGSATQASHFAGELLGRYAYNRPPLPAISLFDLAATTAIANDYGYEEVFARLVMALGRKGDVLVALSTSGNSRNCERALEEARSRGIFAISLLGKDGGKMRDLSDTALIVTQTETPHIQEEHLKIIHRLAGEIESAIFPNPANNQE
jgi:phosphoheptose isomerase